MSNSSESELSSSLNQPSSLPGEDGLQILAIPQIDDEPTLRGTLTEFLDHIQNGFIDPIDSVQALTSSSLEEIQKYRTELEYRSAWLRALLDETNREIQLISQIFEQKTGDSEV
ncbi:hypothetical protein DO97_16900 [Neosynechococcus sphagnicola sy1]|uniref:Uncharacterized protein n=1 Tax=Neosynechococcus sphagnicola sy1 TaxID=1497020 RepID=A0A098TN16_9CYAN|nr:hypothetical protein [Neosynechococcus sphagnicola]KGF73641.1 hypothetical protein DO97_16900 [Neosynechococcus sphagnicola sy1]